MTKQQTILFIINLILISSYWFFEIFKSVEGQRVYVFYYSENPHETGLLMISIHKSRKGAEKAMLYHKEQKLKEFIETQKEGSKSSSPFGQNEFWIVLPEIIK